MKCNGFLFFNNNYTRLQLMLSNRIRSFKQTGKKHFLCTFSPFFFLHSSSYFFTMPGINLLWCHHYPIWMDCEFHVIPNHSVDNSEDVFPFQSSAADVSSVSNGRNALLNVRFVLAKNEPRSLHLNDKTNNRKTHKNNTKIGFVWLTILLLDMNIKSEKWGKFVSFFWFRMKS